MFKKKEKVFNYKKGYFKKYNEVNKEKILNYKKEYRKANKKKILDYSKNYYEIPANWSPG